MTEEEKSRHKESCCTSLVFSDGAAWRARQVGQQQQQQQQTNEPKRSVQSCTKPTTPPKKVFGKTHWTRIFQRGDKGRGHQSLGLLVARRVLLLAGPKTSGCVGVNGVGVGVKCKCKCKCKWAACECQAKGLAAHPTSSLHEPIQPCLISHMGPSDNMHPCPTRILALGSDMWL